MRCLEDRDQYDAIIMTAVVADYSRSCTYEIVEVNRSEGSGIESWEVRSVQAFM